MSAKTVRASAHFNAARCRTPITLSNVSLPPNELIDEFDLEFYRHPDNYLKRTLPEFYDRVRSALASVSLIRHDADALNCLLDPRRVPDRLMTASRAVRRHGYNELYKVLLSHWTSGGSSKRRWFFVSLITDGGNALEYSPVIEAHRTKEAMRAVLSRSGLHAFALLEMQGGTNFPQHGQGRTLMLNGHALGYTDDEDFDLRGVVTKLNEGRLHNCLGAPTVDVKPITQRGELRRRCAYMFKGPSDGKSLMRGANTITGLSLTKAALADPLALRIFEAMSLLDYPDVVWATRDAITLKTEWLRTMDAWLDGRTHISSFPTTAELQNIWRRVWDAASVIVPREPMEVRRDTTRPPDRRWSEAMQLALNTVAWPLRK